MNELDQNEELIRLLPEKRTNDHLKFGNISSIPLKMFLKESFSFTLNYFVDRMPIIVCYILFNFKEKPQYTALLGFAFAFMGRFLVFSYDFQETVSIVLGPSYSQKDIRKYNLNFWRLVFLNSTIFLLNLGVCAHFTEPLFRVINLNPDLVKEYALFTVHLMLTVGPLLTVTNFCRGCLSGRSVSQQLY